MNEIKLPHNREAAAQLMAQGTLNNTELCKQVGISRTTLYTWINNDPNFMERVDQIKQEFQKFGKDLIQSKLVDAIDSYWELIKSGQDTRVTAEGYRFFIQHQIPMPKSKSEIEITANAEDTATISDDLLSTEYDDIIIDYEDIEYEEIEPTGTDDNTTQ